MPAARTGPSLSRVIMGCGARRGGARHPAEVGRSLPDRAPHLRADLCHRGARLQPAARLHRPPVVRAFRLFRYGRLHGGLRRARPSRPLHGAVHPGGACKHARDLGAVRLRVRAPHPHLLRHPDACAQPSAVEPRLQVLLGHGRHRRHPRAAQQHHAAGRADGFQGLRAPTRSSSTPTTTTCWSCSLSRRRSCG